MVNDIVILGSTGSIGNSVLDSIKFQKNFKVKLLTTNKNSKKVLNQAIKYNVKDVIIENEKEFKKNREIFKKKKINLYLGIRNINKIIKNKVKYSINAISGINGLEPTLKIISKSENILIANKESIICGWHLINKKLIKYKTNFIPLDSEHYSIWELIKQDNPKNVEKVILTASGGPFLNMPKNKIINIKPKYAIKHPNWKMGKKISIESSNLMNKIFEFIEAKKIFNLKNNQVSILIHPKSFIHAVVFLKGDLIKFLAHNPKMTIPISNALGIKKQSNIKKLKNYTKIFSSLKFEEPNKDKFPLLALLEILPEKTSFFETILISLNDLLVHKYLNGSINYISIKSNLLKHIKSPYFKKYYKLKPKNIYDIKKISILTKNYLEKNLTKYEK